MQYADKLRGILSKSNEYSSQDLSDKIADLWVATYSDLKKVYPGRESLSLELRKYIVDETNKAWEDVKPLNQKGSRHSNMINSTVIKSVKKKCAETLKDTTSEKIRDTWGSVVIVSNSNFNMDTPFYTPCECCLPTERIKNPQNVFKFTRIDGSSTLSRLSTNRYLFPDAEKVSSELFPNGLYPIGTQEREVQRVEFQPLATTIRVFCVPEHPHTHTPDADALGRGDSGARGYDQGLETRVDAVCNTQGMVEGCRFDRGGSDSDAGEWRLAVV